MKCGIVLLALVILSGAPALSDPIPPNSYSCWRFEGEARKIASLAIVNETQYAFFEAGAPGAGGGAYEFDPASTRVTWLTGPLEGAYSTFSPSPYGKHEDQFWVSSISAHCRLDK